MIANFVTHFNPDCRYSTENKTYMITQEQLKETFERKLALRRYL